MSLATQNDIRCAIDDALKTAQHTHVVNASALDITGGVNGEFVVQVVD